MVDLGSPVFAKATAVVVVADVGGLTDRELTTRGFCPPPILAAAAGAAQPARHVGDWRRKLFVV